MDQKKINNVLWLISSLKKDVNYLEIEAQLGKEIDFMEFDRVWAYLDDAESQLYKIKKQCQEIARFRSNQPL